MADVGLMHFLIPKCMRSQQNYKSDTWPFGALMKGLRYASLSKVEVPRIAAITVYQRLHKKNIFGKYVVFDIIRI